MVALGRPLISDCQGCSQPVAKANYIVDLYGTAEAVP
jgi:hypothetical protein